MKNWIVLALAVFLLLGCVSQPQPQTNTTNTTPVVIVTDNTTTLEPFQPGESVGVGDTVWVDYTLKVNGTVIDTTNATLAKESGIYNANRTYAPLQFVADFNQNLIPGFVADIIGMNINETESFTIDPSMGYGPAVFTAARYYNMSLFTTAPLSYFTDQNLNIHNGTAFTTPIGTVTVANISNGNVTLFYLTLYTTANYTFMNGHIPSRVVSVSKSNYTALIEQLMDVNDTYIILSPATGLPAKWLVTNKTDTNITLENTNPLANDTLDFTVTVVNAEHPVQSDSSQSDIQG
jgi:FKBP-type peptidyl-prolyl cis-trans isomerase 2